MWAGGSAAAVLVSMRTADRSSPSNGAIGSSVAQMVGTPGNTVTRWRAMRSRTSRG